ncbi:flagellar hook capping protein [Aestuariibacter sp. AA17]|uniref:Basal-body rod modification protein FlgD n=1 Tax=Fluctibacter corallii TaxID=2984329 RepID=A0ABT3A9N2_9ALTE|nr:flagellar hook capping FlgD N-terminal domain-containing protein [Aestuariibacter sp. AA17]MCV2885309.1 flagellar hook capping protein [Aestuariibacter sp. AA17]
MEIDAIGGSGSTPTDASSNINLNDFLELFVAQLNYQDPLEPVNNREFLAQLAQFSSLEINRQSNENALSLLAIESTDQAITLIGKTVEINNASSQPFVGEVTSINFSQQGAALTVKAPDGQLMTDVTMGQITVVK